MKFKNYEPIKFEIFQEDMEKIMKVIDDTIKISEAKALGLSCVWKKIKDDFQHKINVHIQRGEWK